MKSFAVWNRKYYFNQVLFCDLYRQVNHFVLNQLLWNFNPCTASSYIWLICFCLLFAYWGVSFSLRNSLSLCFCYCLVQWHPRLCHIVDTFQFSIPSNFRSCSTMYGSLKQIIPKIMQNHTPSLGCCYCYWSSDFSV